MKEETRSITRGRLHTVQLDNRAKAVPVSYTHLDVYKRQDERRENL